MEPNCNLRRACAVVVSIKGIWQRRVTRAGFRALIKAYSTSTVRHFMVANWRLYPGRYNFFTHGNGLLAMGADGESTAWCELWERSKQAPDSVLVVQTFSSAGGAGQICSVCDQLMHQWVKSRKLPKVP